MRLAQPFRRLAVRFDAARLRQEIAALPAEAWAVHPEGHAGNSALRLISVDGGENDLTNGPMRPTPRLARLPYVRQVLASFGVVWSRSRLLRLAPGATVPEHADINHHWFNRVRVHIPVVTQPLVRFHCGGESVHMAAGEAWIFDNWRLHHVENASREARVHLVADTSGSAAFWQFVRASGRAGAPVREVHYDAGRDLEPLTEGVAPPVVMTPAEVDLLLADLRAELAAPEAVPPDAAADTRRRVAHYHTLLDAFARDWRQLYALHGDDPGGWIAFERLREGLRAGAREAGAGFVMASNGIAAQRVLEGRVLRPCLTLDRCVARRPTRPVFIVAAPRSGSTLLYETLAASEAVATLGGEAHWLIEGMAALRPGAPGVESNRLTASQASEAVAARIATDIAARRVDAAGRPVGADAPLRFLEKTPKNVLRIPFLDRVFPDALFVFLWRDPRGNLASIMDAWDAGAWRTYERLEGFDRPWSLLLPPRWRAMQGQPLPDIAAFQWDSANRIALDDLGELPRARWTSVRYEDLVADPRRTVERLCAFTGIELDAALELRVRGALPLSRYTHSAPAPDKWRRREQDVLSVLPRITPTWERLASLAAA
ncbi:MAG: sulfotransferase [Steroidobacteraceae bacterium]